MASSKPFYTVGMTVSQILALGDDVLSKLDKRELSRALRTVSLAANKRIDRLMKHAKKRGGKYVEKADSPGLDLSALNSVRGKKFGVGDKNRNEIYREFARVRSFMNAKTSTVSGAKSSMAGREEILFGKTRKQMKKEAESEVKKQTGKKKLSKQTRQQISKTINKRVNEVMEDTFEAYEEFEEEYETMGIYEPTDGKRRLRDLGSSIMSGKSPEEAKKDLVVTETRNYEEQAQQAAEAESHDWDELFPGEGHEFWEEW